MSEPLVKIEGLKKYFPVRSDAFFGLKNGCGRWMGWI